MSRIFTITKQLSTHGGRLERWLGPEVVAQMSQSMGQWYGPPIAVSGVPGNVWAHKGGDFHGIIKSGQFLNAVDFGIARSKRMLQALGQQNRQQCNTGFASLSALIAAATSGKRRDFFFNKTGVSSGIGASNTLWTAGGSPLAGAAASAAPGGRAPDSTTLGVMPFTNPGGSDTQHFTTGYAAASVASHNLLLYDRIFDAAKTMSSTDTEAVTGVPTRYQSSTSTDPDYAGGNFCFIETQTSLAAGAHNWTVCQYRNQAGTDNQSFPSMAGISGSGALRLDHPAGVWFMPLAAGDIGVMDLAQMQCSASLTGAINFVIGHPIAWMPCPIVNLICVQDGINTAFNLNQILNDAALALLEVNKASSSACTYSGSFTTVSG